MNSFVNSLLAVLMHSIWQSGLLLFIYLIHQFIFSNQSPDSRKLKLIILLILQLFFSALTFAYYKYSGFSIGAIAPKMFSITSIRITAFINQNANLILISYLSFLAIKTYQTLISWTTFKRSISISPMKPPAETRLFTSRKAIELGINKKVKIGFSNHIKSPLTFGHFKPIILLPFALVNNLTTEETETLIIHELTHIRNNDFIINWLVIITEHIYFFNPFIHIISKKIKWEREICCDLQVLQFKYNSIVYADSLFKAARQHVSGNVFQLNAAVKNNLLLDRIKYFTSAGEFKFRKNNFSLLFSFSALLLLVTFSLNILSPENMVNNSKKSSPFNQAINRNEKKKLIFISDDNNQIKPMMATANTITKTPALSEKKIIAKSNSIQQDLNLAANESNGISAVSTSLSDNENSEKQIIVKEEDPYTGKMVTKSYRLIRSNNNWTTQLLWVIEEFKIDDQNQRTILDSKEIPEVQ